MKHTKPTHLDDLQPVVLVGGRSTRFGSDKLVAPLNAGADTKNILVSRPINALREVFGPRVLAVGPCAANVAALADMHLEDQYLAAGPAGGILTVLEWLLARYNGSQGSSPCAALVLSGDLAMITSQTVRLLADAALQQPSVATASIRAVWARNTHPEPCIGVYFFDAIEILRAGICQHPAPSTQSRDASHGQPAPRRTTGLHRLILPEHRIEVPIPEVEGMNINFKEDLEKVTETDPDTRTTGTA